MTMTTTERQNVVELRDKLVEEAEVRLAELTEERENWMVGVYHRGMVVTLGAPHYLGEHLTSPGNSQPRSRKQAYRLTVEEAERTAEELRGRGLVGAEAVSRRAALDLDIQNEIEAIRIFKTITGD